MNLQPAKVPCFLKLGLFGDTGTGKTFTAAKMLSQFIKQYLPNSQLAMFDTEPSAGYISGMVKQITGKELLAVHSRSFSDLLDFWAECEKNKYVALIDSITHPWRSLCADFLAAKKSRVKGAGGREDTVRLTLQDWGPIKDIWNTFSEKYAYGPVHACLCGRQGDVWDTEENDEGKKEQIKTGVKMKTETETGYEPSLLIQMRISGEKPVLHQAFCVKDRFDKITGLLSTDKPDIEFIRPHIDLLDIKRAQAPDKSAGTPVFVAGSGPNWETIKAQREATLEEIKNDILLAYPGQSAEDKKAKVNIMRSAFGTSAWAELESDDKKWTVENLNKGREALRKELEKKPNA